MLTLDPRSGPYMGTASLMERVVDSPMDMQISQHSKPQPSMPAPRHMWIVTGPAGSGKSTVAASLAQKLAVPFIEGDNLHPPSNRKKMESGAPLNDEDRWDWLVRIREAAVAALDTAAIDSKTKHRGVVITCSALKHKYRDVLRVAAYNDHRVSVHFIYLHASQEVLTERVRNRKGHFMAATMVQSQFAALEEPDKTECKKDVLTVDCSGDSAAVDTEVMFKVQEALASHTTNGY